MALVLVQESKIFVNTGAYYQNRGTNHFYLMSSTWPIWFSIPTIGTLKQWLIKAFLHPRTIAFPVYLLFGVNKELCLTRLILNVNLNEEEGTLFIQCNNI